MAAGSFDDGNGVSRMKKIKWGIIGAGGIAARRTIPEAMAMLRDVEFVSAMCRTRSSAKKVAGRFGIPHYCDSEKELLLQDVDAVYIASPQDAHCDQVIEAARTGKHILCEKPMAITPAEVDRMESAVRKAGVKFMLGFCMRNNAYNIKAREIAQAGALGQMVMGRAQLTCWYPPIATSWRQDVRVSHGGSLIDMGTHCLDLLEWIMGTRIREVCGFQDLMTHKYRTRIEDASTLAVRFENGAHGIIDNYFNLPDAAAQNTLELHGTKGSLIGQGTIGQDPTGRMFSIIQRQEPGYNASQVRNTKVTRREYRLKCESLYGRMIADFNRCIRENREPPVPLDDGRHSVRLVQAIYRAVKTRRVVEVE